MARPKKPEPSERIHLPRSVARRIRRLAAHHDMEPGDYVTHLINPLLDCDEAKMVAGIPKERKAAKRS